VGALCTGIARKAGMRTEHFKTFKQRFMIAISAICIVSVFAVGQSEARRELTEKGKELKGIAFHEFWENVRIEGRKWAGDRLYISKISSGNFKGFDKYSGLSPVWEAYLVKCSDIIEKIEHGKILLFCKGKVKILRQVESGIIGMEAGLHVKKETGFSGAAVDFDRIKLSARSAEYEANQHMRYRLSGYDNYTYDLKIDHFSNRPVWIIKKACSLRGALEGKCRSKDHWIVKVDGETGDIIKQSDFK